MRRNQDPKQPNDFSKYKFLIKRNHCTFYGQGWLSSKTLNADADHSYFTKRMKQHLSLYYGYVDSTDAKYLPKGSGCTVGISMLCYAIHTHCAARTLRKIFRISRVNIAIIKR